MLRLRQRLADQRSFLDEFLPPELRDLPEDFAKLDRWLNDERFFQPFLGHYHRRLGRPSIPAETYLRMMVLKHQYGLSDRQLCASVVERINWRRFCRIPWDQAVPHPSSLSKIRGRLDADGGDHMALLNEHLVRKATEEGLLKARKIRVDTTAIEANIHHPTDAGLIYDGVRTVSRLVKQAQALGASAGQRFRDRTRSVRKRLLSITKVLRRRTGEAHPPSVGPREVRHITGEMAEIGAKTLQAAKGVLEEAKVSADAAVKRVADRLMSVQERVARVIEQARQVNEGHLTIPDRLVSIFDPDARPIRRGKLDRPTEFGYKVCLTESEERVVTEYRVFKGNPPDSALLVDAVQGHCQHVGRTPARTATDRGFWSPGNERALMELGVRKVSMPRRGKESVKRREYERQSWFRRLQRWRAGQEATISVLKRRYGLDRTLYRGADGSRRWVGEAVWGYNLRRIAQLA
jgi:IS5 family transposase